MLIAYLLTLTLGALIGGALFMLLPVAYDSENIGHKYVWLSMFALKRGAIVVQDDGELNWKKLKYDPVGAEKVKLGADVITLSDPARALRSFKGRTLALADETHGVLFRPSDAIAGYRTRELSKRDELVSDATKTQRKKHKVAVWIRKYMHIPTHAPVDLRNVRELATGSEEGSDAWLVRTWYKFSRIRDNMQTSPWKLMIPAAAFVLTLIIFWQASSQGGSSGSPPANPGGNNTTLTYLAFVTVPYAAQIKRVCAILMPLVALVVGYVLFGFTVVSFPIVFAIGLAIGFVGTGAFVLLICLIGMGGWLSTFFLDMGLQCFDNPIITETSDGYKLLESDGDIDGPTHKLGKHRIAFQVSRTGVKSRDGYVGTSKVVAKSIGDGAPYKDPNDGGEFYGYFKHKVDPSLNYVYITVYDAVSSLANGFVGKDTDSRHKEAKEEFGDGISDIGDITVIVATFVAIILAVGVGWVML